MPELLQKIPDMKDITEYWIIYPHKIQVPLHKDDLLYESKRNYSSALNLGEFSDLYALLILFMRALINCAVRIAVWRRPLPVRAPAQVARVDVCPEAFR